MEVDRRSPGCTKADGRWWRYPGCMNSWQNLLEGLPLVWNVNGNWQKVSWLHRNSKEVDKSSLAERKFDQSWCKFSWQHRVFWLRRMLTEVHGRSYGGTECWRSVSQLLGKLMEVDRSFPAARKLMEVEENSPDGKVCWQKFMDDLRAESWQKILWQQGKLMEFDRISPGHKESWQKLTEGLLTQRKLMEVDRRSPGCTEFHGRSPGHTENWRKFKETG